MPIETRTTEVAPALFLDFLDPDLSLLDLAERHNLSLDDLLDWAESPDTRSHLTRLHNLSTFRNSFLAAGALPAALSSLSTAARRSAPAEADPIFAQRTTETARRAASQLARLAAVAQASRLCESRDSSRATDFSRATDYLALQIVGAPPAPVFAHIQEDAPLPPAEAAQASLAAAASDPGAHPASAALAIIVAGQPESEQAGAQPNAPAAPNPPGETCTGPVAETVFPDPSGNIPRHNRQSHQPRFACAGALPERAAAHPAAWP